MRKSTILIMFVLMAAMKAIAQNPVVQTWYTSDPAPMVFGDRIYMYTGHDEDKADFFWMNEWRIYSSSEDMPRVIKGIGTAIVSTSKGLMTDKEARKNDIGGEVLAYIW